MRGFGAPRLAALLLVVLVPAVSAAQWPPLPPPRPADLGNGPAETPLPPERPADVGPADLPAVEAACRQRLTTKGIMFEPLPAIQDGACGAPHPLQVSRLADGVTIGTPAAMTCALAEALADWSRESVTREARERLGTSLSRIVVGTTYECRGQNRDPSARLSEHAFANGADIAGFAFVDGKRVAVGPPPASDEEAGFLAAVRASACTVFTTVLGPGSDGHADHIHLDMRARPGGYRICQ